MTRARNLGNLASNNGIISDIDNNKIGIGTTVATSALTVVGDVLVSGVVTATAFIGDGSGLTGAGSTVVVDNSTDQTLYPILTSQTSGTITASKVSTTKLTFNPSTGSISAIGASIGNVKIGVGNTELIVTGDARVTGILTVGTASVTIDGENTQINVGSATTIYETGFKIGDSDLHSTGLSLININATGIVTASSFSGSASNLTNLNASNLSSGVVPAARITSTSALNVGGDLYVSGNISFGGTTTQLNTSQLTFSDPDIVLGVGTTSTFNPTDDTANHGGIAIASTEGTPLVNLNISPAEILPITYKKFMWFKNNTAGLGTDAWLSNYAVGIGSTQFPRGTRLASGNVQFDTNDLKVIRHINSSGIITATSFVGDGSGLTGAGSTVADDTSSNATFYPVLTQTTSGTITASKVSTSKLLFNPSTGILTATQVNDAGGNLRSLSNNAKTGSYTLAIGDVGELINITTGGVTVPAGVFSAGDSVTIYNNSASSQTITQGASTTLRLAGTSLTGNRTLDQRGITTIMCVASNEFVISGAGLS